MRRAAFLPLTFLCALAAGACNSAASPPVEADVPEGPAAVTASLPDLTKEFETGRCEQIKGSEIPGADSYFHGRFSFDGTAVSGTETWWLHANKAWKEHGGNSCDLTWTVSGTKTTTTACGDCDFGLKLSSSPQTGNSSCPESLIKREAKHSELGYDVKLADNGEAFVYFAKSGKLLGQGYHQDGVLVYRTQHQCKWF